MRILKHQIALAIVALGTIHCGSDDHSSTRTDHASDALAGEGADQVLTPPQEYYDAVMRYELSLVDGASNAVAARPTLFLDFDGGEVAKGYDINQSFIVCNNIAKLPASPFSTSEQDSIVGMVQEFYAKAGSNLLVSRTPPKERPYTTIMVGGSMADLGCGERLGAFGIAPFDIGNTNRNDIGFVFTENQDVLDITAETIAYEAAHTYGLNHIPEDAGGLFQEVALEALPAKAKVLETLANILKSLSGTTVPGSGGTNLASILTPILSGLLAGKIENLGGLPGIDTWIKLLNDLKVSGNTSINTQAGEGLDFAKLLKLETITDIQGLLKSLALSKQALQNGYDADQRQMLSTIIKLSHAQAYQKLRSK